MREMTHTNSSTQMNSLFIKKHLEDTVTRSVHAYYIYSTSGLDIGIVYKHYMNNAIDQCFDYLRITCSQ